MLDPGRLFPAERGTRDIARGLYAQIKDMPIVSPHGHCDPAWFATNAPFPDPARLFVVPDHYVLRMLVSQGLSLEDLGVARLDGTPVETDGRKIWRLFAAHFYLFQGTPSRLWIDHALSDVFGIGERLSPANADSIFDRVAAALESPQFRPRALYERFNIEVLATTDSATDELIHHEAIRKLSWKGRIIPTYRPDATVDPEFKGFAGNVRRLGELTDCDTSTWTGYLDAHRKRRAAFRALGATATDHGHPTARTERLNAIEAESLFARCLKESVSAGDAELFRAHMLTEMALMSAEDGMVMQIHAGSQRNHAPFILERFGRDKGFDIPQPTNYVQALRPLLDAVGLNPQVSVILFTLDETAYARELAPLAGAYPALKLGPPWWFHDSPEGMLRFRQQVTETAGLYNTAGFNDDTRAFCSIPARHDVARRVDCAWLATLVADGRLDRAEAEGLAGELTTGLAKKAYKL